MNKIAKQEHTFKSYARTYNVETLNTFNSEVQPKDTESAIKTKLVELLAQVGFKFVTTLVLLFKPIESKGKKKYGNFYSSSKAESIRINESGIDDVFKSIYTTIIINIQKSLGKGTGWIIDSVIDHTISISKYNPLCGSSYIKFSKELDHPTKGLIKIQNTDHNEWFK